MTKNMVAIWLDEASLASLVLLLFSKQLPIFLKLLKLKNRARVC
uniref:Uncharacterized protein n=1 Tax=Rhodnius prolixus TaxID=13249 RepID=T1IGP5_RHOPR